MYINRLYYPYTKNGSLILIKGSKFFYLKNVLKKKNKDHIIIFNGRGREYFCVIQEMKKFFTIIKIKKKLKILETTLFLNVVQPTIKKKNFENILKMSNEIGVYSFSPIMTKYTSYEYLLTNNKKYMIHLEKKIISSSEQCGRNNIMVLNKMKTIEKFCIEIKYISSIKIYLQPFSKNSFFDLFKIMNSRKEKIAKNKVFIIVGPEGGFSKEEIFLLQKSQFTDYKLFNSILCSETAMLSSVSIVLNLLHYRKKRIEKK